MTDPDDDWGDLARELGVQKPTTPPAAEAAAEPAEHHAEWQPEAAEGEQEEFAEGLADEAPAEEGEVESEGDADGEGEAGEGEAGGEDGPGEEGQPGTGRKRRRRRRRRKKGGPEGEAADAGIADEPAPSYQAAARVSPPVRPPAPVVARPAAVVESDEVDADDEGEVGGPTPPAEEDTAGEVLRELIATWNVPSWDEIISGLHR